MKDVKFKVIRTKIKIEKKIKNNGRAFSIFYIYTKNVKFKIN